MNKRIICLLMSLIMLVGVLASCGTKDKDAAQSNIQEQASVYTETYSFYLMSEKEVSADQEKAIEDAINKITKAKFKTQLDLRFYTEDEYYEVLEKHFEEEKAYLAANSGFGKQTTESATAEETFINEDGLVELKYPTIQDFQVDIFYFGGYDKYKQYSEASYLTKLDDDITNASKLLSSFYSPLFLSQIKAMNGGTFALPINKPIGEYKFVLLNKDVVSAMNYGTIDGNSDYSAFTSLTCDSCKDILEYVDTYLSEEYVPLWSGTDDELDIINVKYFGVDENGALSEDFSLLGSNFDPKWTYGVKNDFNAPANIFANSNFTSQMITLKEYEDKGYYAEEGEEDLPFAVGYVEGGAEVMEIYGDDYVVIPVSKPVLTTDQVYADMFGVSTTDYARCMEVLTYLSTNTTLRNLLAYGIEGENYEIVEETLEDLNGETKTYKKVRMLNDNYSMDINKTGNVLIAYPLEDQVGNLREYQQLQNRDAKSHYIIGFSLDQPGVTLNDEQLQALRELSAEKYEEMLECEDAEELATFFSDSIATVTVEDCFYVNSDMNYKVGGETYNEEKYGEGAGFASVFFGWLEKVGMFDPEG